MKPPKPKRKTIPLQENVSMDKVGSCKTRLAIAALMVAWLALLESASNTAVANPQEVQTIADRRDGQHDFDFHFGRWKTHASRLLHPLSGSHQWVEYEGVSVVRKVWGGLASLFELDVTGPAGHIEGAGLRLYDPASRQWSLNWASTNVPRITTPMIGEFRAGRGQFFDHEIYDGRGILARNGFFDITTDSSRFEQAFSVDGGKTWETNWVMTFTRLPDACATPNNCD
jgi:hypothetical protein